MIAQSDPRFRGCAYRLNFRRIGLNIEQGAVRTIVLDDVDAQRLSLVKLPANALGQTDALLTPHRLYESLGYSTIRARSGFSVVGRIFQIVIG